LSTLLLLLLPAVATAAEGGFPRGPGLYFNLFKIVAVFLVYLLWMRIVWWVDQDAAEFKDMPVQTWNAGVFAGGVVGLAAAWAVPWFFVSFVLLLLLSMGPPFAYAQVRNKLVPYSERVLTKKHLRQLAHDWLKIPLSEKERKKKEQVIPLVFHSKGATGRAADKASVSRAQGSPGYRAALEMVWEALELRATDIHMEPEKEQLTVRYRIDGILQTASPFSRSMGDAVLNIFKVLANLDITEKRKPQDGSFSGEVIKENGSERDTSDNSNIIDFRVATAGSVAGEKLVMRILDQSRRVGTLTEIGMRDKMRKIIEDIVGQPHGMFIVCGPTGAGKSTTLYASLGEIDCFQKNVITVENPVEYQIPNVTQIEVNPKAGKTFSSELRSILRQDPDVIYIGEIRDNETAEIACQAAQTGHMVLTTLHANDTVTAVGRLLDLGVQPFLIANAVSAILGQRLVRVLCPKCKQKYKPNPEMLRKANLPADKIKFFCRPPAEPDPDSPEAAKMPQCTHCGGTGYRGRTGVFELLVFTDKVRGLIRDNPDLNAIRQEAVKNGMKSLQEDGLRQVIEGDTSIQELLRVSK
jgi:type II secretory ATPase GspE/PulE/Tfp pilus assembly ATPase PilB-like protein